MSSKQTDPMFVKDGPSLPYGGTTGHSGTAASREMAETEASDGTAAARQRRIRAALEKAGPVGVTVAEFRNEAIGDHHGKVSSAFTALHIAGDVVRLKERRERNSVYVLLAHAGDRPTSPYRPRNRPVEGGEPESLRDATARLGEAQAEIRRLTTENERLVSEIADSALSVADAEFFNTVRAASAAIEDAKVPVRINGSTIHRLLRIIEGLTK